MTLRELEYEMLEVVASHLLYRSREFVCSKNLYYAVGLTQRTRWPLGIVVYCGSLNEKETREWFAWWQTPKVEGDLDELVFRYFDHD